MCINYEEEFDEGLMWVPCEHCRGWFDLPDGYGSELWYPNIVICPSCHNLEKAEMERREEIENALNVLEDAEYSIKEANETLKKYKYIKNEEKQW